MTGFALDRAVPHEERVASLIAVLSVRGYQPVQLPVDGDRPDVLVSMTGYNALVDVKIPYSGHANYSIKSGALREFQRIEREERTVVFVVWGDNRVDRPDEIERRIIGDEREPTGRGSNTAWFLVRCCGSRTFNEVFPS